MFRFIPKEVPENLRSDIKSIPEEIANMLSHGLGLLLALLGFPFLIGKALGQVDSCSLVGFVVYGFSLIMLYTSSTLYHSSYELVTRKKLRIFDHISIYFLIAGSYTPFILVSLNNTKGYVILVVLWLMVLLGSIFKLFFTHKFRVLSTIAYLVMGWMAILILKPMYLALPPASFWWIVAGGASYTLGSIFYLWKKLYQNHFIWHLFVLGGSIAHFVAVYYLLVD